MNKNKLSRLRELCKKDLAKEYELGHGTYGFIVEKHVDGFFGGYISSNRDAKNMIIQLKQKNGSSPLIPADNGGYIFVNGSGKSKKTYLLTNECCEEFKTKVDELITTEEVEFSDVLKSLRERVQLAREDVVKAEKMSEEQREKQGVNLEELYVNYNNMRKALKEMEDKNLVKDKKDFNKQGLQGLVDDKARPLTEQLAEVEAELKKADEKELEEINAELDNMNSKNSKTLDEDLELIQHNDKAVVEEEKPTAVVPVGPVKTIKSNKEQNEEYFNALIKEKHDRKVAQQNVVNAFAAAAAQKAADEKASQERYAAAEASRQAQIKGLHDSNFMADPLGNRDKMQNVIDEKTKENGKLKKDLKKEKSNRAEDAKRHSAEIKKRDSQLKTEEKKVYKRSTALKYLGLALGVLAIATVALGIVHCAGKNEEPKEPTTPNQPTTPVVPEDPTKPKPGDEDVSTIVNSTSWQDAAKNFIEKNDADPDKSTEIKKVTVKDGVMTIETENRLYEAKLKKNDDGDYVDSKGNVIEINAQSAKPIVMASELTAKYQTVESAFEYYIGEGMLPKDFVEAEIYEKYKDDHAMYGNDDNVRAYFKMSAANNFSVVEVLYVGEDNGKEFKDDSTKVGVKMKDGVDSAKAVIAAVTGSCEGCTVFPVEYTEDKGYVFVTPDGKEFN